MARSRHYVVEGWRQGSNVWWATPKQRAAVVRHVQAAVLDHGATIVHVAFYAGTGDLVEVAQVTSALVWKWSGRPEAADLRKYVEAER